MNMKPIVEYQDYRIFMSDYYEERKRSSAFSWREFAKIAGFTSPSYLKLVCEGKSSLSRVTMERVAVAMGLVGYEVDYFKAMVNFGNAKKDVAKRRYFDEMHAIASAHKVRVIDKAAFGEIAKMCNQDISAYEVRKSLIFLERTGLLKKVGEETYEQTEKSVKGSKEGLPIAIRSMHREMGRLAVDSLEKFDSSERNVTGITMGLNREAYEKIVDELDDCRKKIVAIAAECGELDQVYRLNLQLFPLTKQVKGSKEN